MSSVTPVMIAVFGLLLVGVVASLLGRVPGIVFSIAGVSLYWWDSGYTEPGTLTLALLTLVAVLVLAGQVFDRFVVSRVGGVSTVTATLGGFVGAIAFAFLGSTGLVLGTIVTVFVVEYVRRRDARRSFLAALAVVFGTFAARLVRTLMAVLVLFVMLTVVV
jgi:uncharacterized protein YqgC (DUF456 family)